MCVDDVAGNIVQALWNGRGSSAGCGSPWQGLTLVHFSIQPKTFSAPGTPKSPGVSHERCLRCAEECPEP